MNDRPHNPRVSIGMPVYNGERYLAATLDSVLRQTYRDFILYISDNASTDGTEAICRDYASRDARIVYIRNPVNVGAPGNYERCFTPAQSEYFRWQNADDPIEPTLIADCLHVLDQHPDVVLAYGRAHIIDENSQLQRDYSDHLSLPQESATERFIHCINHIDLQNHMYGLIRREALANSARMKGYRSADINLIVELSLYGKFVELPQHLFNRRIHPEASSWDQKDVKRQINFWDPSKRKLILQTWRSFYEYFKAVHRAPIPFADKKQLCIYLLKRAYWRKSFMLGEVVDLIKSGILRLS